MLSRLTGLRGFSGVRGDDLDTDIIGAYNSNVSVNVEYISPLCLNNVFESTTYTFLLIISGYDYEISTRAVGWANV